MQICEFKEFLEHYSEDKDIFFEVEDDTQCMDFEVTGVEYAGTNEHGCPVFRLHFENNVAYDWRNEE